MKKIPGFKEKPSLWLTVIGAVLLVICNYNTTVGFLFFAMGGGCIAAAWVVFVLQKSRQTSHKILFLILKAITFTMLAVILISFIMIEGEILRKSDGTENPTAKTLIVLGAGIRGEKPSGVLAARLRTAKDYLDDHPDAVAVLSGGQGSDEQYTEAAVMKNYLISLGVEEQRLYLEEESHNTRQNLWFSQRVIAEKALPGPYAVVSTGSHLARARYLAEACGLTVETIAAPLPYAYLIPGVYLREYCSVVLMLLKEWI